MKRIVFYCSVLLVVCSIIPIKGSDLEEKSTSGLQMKEKGFDAILDVFRRIKDSYLFRILDDIPNEQIGEKVTEECKTGNTGKLTITGSLLKPSNCAELQLSGFTVNGVYDIFPKGRRNPISVYCDFKTDGGGWTVFQRRGEFGEPKENFFRNWREYKFGFGDLNKEFWLGNEKIFILTTNDRMTMRVDLEDHENDKKYAEYKDFSIDVGDYSYKMTYKNYGGNAGDSLFNHVDQDFATFDKDNANNCAAGYKGGWWYHNCHSSNLNGLYYNATEQPDTRCTNWGTFKNDNRCMKSTEMKLRPNYFEDLQAL